jgi:hypothetical protein
MSWVTDGLHWPGLVAGWSAVRAEWRSAAGARARALRAETQAVRHAMLAALGEAGREPGLRMKLLHAPDAECLWHLRNELMVALAARDGEAAATDHLARLTPLFRNLLPPGLACRLGTPAPQSGEH